MGLELEIALVGGHGFLLASEPLEHGAEQELGAGIFRVQLRGLLERLDGIAQLIAFEKGVAQRQERGDRVGTQLDRLAELCDGRPVLAPLEQRVSTRERPAVVRGIGGRRHRAAGDGGQPRVGGSAGRWWWLGGGRRGDGSGSSRRRFGRRRGGATMRTPQQDRRGGERDQGTARDRQTSAGPAHPRVQCARPRSHRARNGRGPLRARVRRRGALRVQRGRSTVVCRDCDGVRERGADLVGACLAIPRTRPGRRLGDSGIGAAARRDPGTDHARDGKVGCEPLRGVAHRDGHPARALRHRVGPARRGRQLENVR